MRLVIPGRPVPAARPRVAHGHAYYPKRYREWLDAAAWGLVSAKPVSGAVRVRLVFRADQVIVEVLPGCARPDGIRADLDNLVKAVLDALVLGGVLEDDSQVTAVEASLEG